MQAQNLKAFCSLFTCRAYINIRTSAHPHIDTPKEQNIQIRIFTFMQNFKFTIENLANYKVNLDSTVLFRRVIGQVRLSGQILFVLCGITIKFLSL